MTRRRSVLFVSNTAQGMVRFRRSVLVDLLARGYSVFCCAAPDGTESDIKRIGAMFFPWRISRSGMNPLAEIVVIFRLFKVLRTVQPALSFFYTIKACAYGPFLSRMIGSRSVAVVTGLGYAFLNNGLKARLARLTLRAGLFFADHIWFLNTADRDAFIAYGMVSLNKTTVIPGEGINTEFFRPGAAEPQEKVHRFLMIARLLKDKGVEEYIEAARRVRQQHGDVDFHLVGPFDSGNPACIDPDVIARAAVNDIVYIGEKSDVREDIATADAVILPSYREGVPRVLLEAAAMEKPMISTDVPGCRDVVENGLTGLLCRPRDAADLARVCLDFISLPLARRVEMGARARRSVLEKFDETHVLQYYHRILEREDA